MVRHTLLGCVLLLTVALPTSVGAQTTTLVTASVMQEAHATGQVRVLLRLAVNIVPEGDAATDAGVFQQRADIANAQGAVLRNLRGVAHVVHRQYQTIPFLAIEASADALRVIEALHGLVVQVDEDTLDRPTLAQSGPLVGAPTAWNSGFDGTGAVIAVLDTGVASTHPFLAGKVAEEVCFSSTTANTITLCTNGMHTQFGPGAASPCTLSGCNHGTHVAGIAAGAGPSFSGIAKGARLIAVKVFSRVTSAAICSPDPAPCIRAFTSDVMQALEHVFLLRNTYNIAAANLSLGGGQFTSVCDTDPRKPVIDNLRSVRIATIVSSGNEGFTNALSAPACISTAISVGSTTKSDVVSTFSNTASFLSLLAPGQSITSSIPGGGFAVISGTSMATPHVAGAFAILRQASPTATMDQILVSLQVTGLPLRDADAGITKPRIRVDQALAFLAGPVRNFVSGFYTNVLGRAADPVGLAAWTSFLQSHCNPAGANAIADAFFDSTEFRTARPLTLNDLVTVLYRTFLNRNPEPTGLAGWADAFRQQRVSIAVTSFIPSGEFQSLLPDRRNETAVRAVVTRLYAEVLGRPAETAGLNSWVNYIVATDDLEGTATAFLVSAEFEERALTFQGYVRILYRAFLGREPDPGGLAAFEAILRGHLLGIIHNGFTPSAEFQDVIDQVCSD